MSEKKERSLFSKVMLFAGMFGIPAFFILFFMTGNQNFEKLLYYGEHTVITKNIDGEEVNDTIYYKVPGFKFNLYDGSELTHKDLKDKILLINHVQKDCPSGTCYIDFLNFQMFVADEIAQNEGFEDVVIISHFDSDSDDIHQEIADFINYHKIDTKQWKFVTGDMGQIYDTDMKIQNPWTAPDTVTHVKAPKQAYVLTLLLDRELHIRGKYVTCQTSENKRVTKEISILLRTEKEELEAKQK